VLQSEAIVFCQSLQTACKFCKWICINNVIHCPLLATLQTADMAGSISEICKTLAMMTWLVAECWLFDITAYEGLPTCATWIGGRYQHRYQSHRKTQYINRQYLVLSNLKQHSNIIQPVTIILKTKVY